MENRSKKSYYKSCIVLSCNNTTISTPDKLFLPVPINPKVRYNWCIALKRNLTSKTLYCCEDHFDMSEDTDNWMRYKLTQNVKLRLKKDVVPHIFNNAENADNKRVAALKLAQKRLVEEALAAAEEKERLARLEEERLQQLRLERISILPETTRGCSFETVLINTDGIEADDFTSEDVVVVKPLGKDKAVQVRPYFRSKGTTCYLEMAEPLPKQRGRKRKRSKRKKQQRIVMTVSEGSGDDESECCKPLRRASLSSSNEDLKLEYVAELVETTLGDYDHPSNSHELQSDVSSCDKAVQAWLRPSYRSKGITCSLPIVPLERKVTPRTQQPLLTEKNYQSINYPAPNLAFDFSNIYMNTDSSESIDSNQQYVVVETNRFSYMVDKSYVAENEQPDFLPRGEICKQRTKSSQGCQVPDIKPKMKSERHINILKRVKLDDELVPVKKALKEEIVNEDYKECCLLPLSPIKCEVEDCADDLSPRNFIAYSIKQEPHFEEFADTNLLVKD